MAALNVAGKIATAANLAVWRTLDAGARGMGDLRWPPFQMSKDLASPVLFKGRIAAYSVYRNGLKQRCSTKLAYSGGNIKTVCVSKIRSQQTCQTVTQPDRKATAVDFVQRDLVSVLNLPVDQLVQRLGQLLVVALHVKFKIKPQAPRVPIGRSDQRPDAIDDHQLGVVEW